MLGHNIAGTSIRFPNIGIEFHNVPTNFMVLGLKIALYGVMIALGMACGYLVVKRIAKMSSQDSELYLDYAIYAIAISVIGARLCYVAFDLNSFIHNPLSILNLRTGGLAIYGGIIAAIFTGLIYCRIKKYSFFLLADTGIPGLLAGQIIGRWGNFFNREVFGRYTNNILAMQINIKDAGYDYNCSLKELSERYEGKQKSIDMIMEVRNHIRIVGEEAYIQVHPTFLYESLWNLGLLIIILMYWKHKKFQGEVLLIYLAGYGIGRLWIEHIRTDRLYIWGTSIPVFMLLSIILAVFSVIVIIIKRFMIRRKLVK